MSFATPSIRLFKTLDHVFVDMDYRGHNYTGSAKIHVGKRRRVAFLKVYGDG